MNFSRGDCSNDMVVSALTRNDQRIIASGFRVPPLGEPQPVPAARDRFPNNFEALATQPNFLLQLASPLCPAVRHQRRRQDVGGGLIRR